MQPALTEDSYSSDNEARILLLPLLLFVWIGGRAAKSDGQNLIGIREFATTCRELHKSWKKSCSPIGFTYRRYYAMWECGMGFRRRLSPPRPIVVVDVFLETSPCLPFP